MSVWYIASSLVVEYSAWLVGIAWVKPKLRPLPELFYTVVLEGMDAGDLI